VRIQKVLASDVFSYLKDVLEDCAEFKGEQFNTRTKNWNMFLELILQNTRENYVQMYLQILLDSPSFGEFKKGILLSDVPEQSKQLTCKYFV